MFIYFTTLLNYFRSFSLFDRFLSLGNVSVLMILSLGHRGLIVWWVLLSMFLLTLLLSQSKELCSKSGHLVLVLLDILLPLTMMLQESIQHSLLCLKCCIIITIRCSLWVSDGNQDFSFLAVFIFSAVVLLHDVIKLLIIMNCRGFLLSCLCLFTRWFIFLCLLNIGQWG